tara:strand:- start:2068 stop:2748 length:681 start_codon:yes stop_codon:yes gene_type:complete
MGLTKVHPGEKNIFLGSIGIGIPPNERLSVAGNISASGSVNAASFSGDWQGNILSGENISVEGVDIKSTGQTEDLFLKSTGNGKVVWDTIDIGEEIVFDNQNIDGNLTVRGDIIEYAADGIVYSKTSVFSKSLTSGANTLNTFNKTQFKTAKYVITLSDESFNRTACEVLVTHNESSADGTTYGIVDAQATSLLTNINANVGFSYIDLVITVSADCTATVHGVAHY